MYFIGGFWCFNILLLSATLINGQIQFPTEEAPILQPIHFPGHHSGQESVEGSGQAAAPSTRKPLEENDKEISEAIESLEKLGTAWNETEVLTRAYDGGVCRTPLGEWGTCTHPRVCSYFHQYLRRLYDFYVKQFLRQHLCPRTFFREITLCCPFNSPNHIGRDPFFDPFRPPQQHPQIPPRNQPECGNEISSRIVDGRPTQPGDFPWLVGVGIDAGTNNFRVICGGSLLNRRQVLTAAHCVVARSLSLMPTHLRLGDHNLRSSQERGSPQTRWIARKVMSNYNKETNENDIAILDMDRDVFFNEFIKPACLTNRFRFEEFRDRTFKVVGWGTTETESVSPIPLTATVPSVDVRMCKRMYHDSPLLRIKPVIDDRHLCAGVGGADSCQGDSGGPLLYLDLSDGKYYVVGIVSFGVGCGTMEFPGVYTRVGAFMDWINDNSISS